MYVIFYVLAWAVGIRKCSLRIGCLVYIFSMFVVLYRRCGQVGAINCFACRVLQSLPVETFGVL